MLVVNQLVKIIMITRITVWKNQICIPAIPPNQVEAKTNSNPEILSPDYAYANSMARNQRHDQGVPIVKWKTL